MRAMETVAVLPLAAARAWAEDTERGWRPGRPRAVSALGLVDAPRAIGYRPQHVPAPDDISREELRRRLRDPSLVLVDVLPASSYLAGHIPGALSLPVDDIPGRAAALLPERDKEIVLYCGSFT